MVIIWISDKYVFSRRIAWICREWCSSQSLSCFFLHVLSSFLLNFKTLRSNQFWTLWSLGHGSRCFFNGLWLLCKILKRIFLAYHHIHCILYSTHYKVLKTYIWKWNLLCLPFSFIQHQSNSCHYIQYLENWRPFYPGNFWYTNEARRMHLFDLIFCTDPHTSWQESLGMLLSNRNLFQPDALSQFGDKLWETSPGNVSSLLNIFWCPLQTRRGCTKFIQFATYCHCSELPCLFWSNLG